MRLHQRVRVVLPFLRYRMQQPSLVHVPIGIAAHHDRLDDREALDGTLDQCCIGLRRLAFDHVENDVMMGQGGRIIPVGTTALRLIESAASGGVIAPFRGETDIFIRPGYRFRLADGLITNFHLPKSTLLMLVAALMGKERIDQVYAHAIANGYRFFSYGDGSLLIP